MKIQLGLLLLVVLFVSLPSVVFSQPPLSAVQSGETSQTAPTAETVQKSWEGPFFGLGLGLGYGQGSFSAGGASIDTGTSAGLAGQIRLGYGLSDRAVLYGSLRSFNFGTGWTLPAGLLGFMFRGRDNTPYYGFAALGASVARDEIFQTRALYITGGSGAELYKGLSLEGTGTYEYANLAGVSSTAFILDLTFNYHFY